MLFDNQAVNQVLLFKLLQQLPLLQQLVLQGRPLCAALGRVLVVVLLKELRGREPLDAVLVGAFERLSLGVVSLRHMLVSLSNAFESELACQRVPAGYRDLHAVSRLVPLQGLLVAEQLVALGALERLGPVSLPQVPVQGAPRLESRTTFVACQLLRPVVLHLNVSL